MDITHMATANTEHFNWVTFGTSEADAKRALVDAFVSDVERVARGDHEGEPFAEWRGRRPTVKGFEDYYGIAVYEVRPGVAYRDGEPLTAG